ncbi:hypothetical protein BDN72DRAFT_845290 [Pluteus cervinus]|uniref:Uncharacterized protein n=1 Tax=Pluteus cervinus TaxID=181527 RepID=A0ACD3AK78_9AGAR|nr:hypothetical protein BDN72DRAFT_845290 [Pluteus cervinus]
MLGTEADCRSWGEPVAAKLREEERADTDKLVAWWHRVHIPVEIRPSTRSSADELDSTFSVEDNNLLGYMRQTFREQHDRQFMVGLLLCGTQLSIIHCDRSGVVSTKDPIDIHKNPKDFIRIIAGCVLSPPSQLGWDLSMKLWIPQLGQFMHSYSKYLLFSHFHQLEYRLSWVIIIADDRYVTIETLSARQSEVMVGRTSVIWAAVRLGDPPSERPKIYVIKQTWKPVSATPEWDFYDIGSDIKFVPSLESYDERTKTSQIRQGLSGIGPVLAKSGVRRYCLPSDGWNLQDSPAPKLWIEKKPKIPKIVDRVQTRVVMKSYGWPLSCFKSLKELLSVIKDIVLAHRLLYHRGTLHRDMSSSNMLISPVPADSNSVHGLLIDFEFALSTNTIRVPESRKWTSSLKVHENTDRHKLIRKFPGFPKSAIDVWTLYGSHFPFEIDRLGELRGFQEESEVSRPYLIQLSFSSWFVDIHARYPAL